MFKAWSSVLAALSLAMLALSESLTLQAEKEFASGFLQMLDMDHAPNISSDRHDIPRYILNLYKGKLTWKRSSVGRRIPDGSTTRILFPQDLNEDTDSSVLQFNLSSVDLGSGKILRKAELHVQVFCGEGVNVKVSIVYSDGSQNIADGDKETISTRDCHKTIKSRWLVFNLTQVILSKVKRRRGTVTLAISTNPAFKITTKGKRKPFLVVFNEPLEIPNQGVLGAPPMKRRQFVTGNATENSHGKLSRTKRSEDNMCRKRRLAVRFRDLKWSGWIIAPTRFGFHYCEGSCPGTLSLDSNPTNHAILQNIIHHRLGKKIPAATCVATELRSMSLLYYDHDDTIVLRDVPGMVASDCGCR